MNNEKKSTVFFGTRGTVTETNKYGWYSFNSDINKPCILVLGGDGTRADAAANGYAKKFEDLIRTRGLSGRVDVCSAVYDFGDLGSSLSDARQTLMEKHKRGLQTFKRSNATIQSEIENPQYVDDIYNHFFKERISDKNGKKLPVDEAVRRMRNLTIFGHCHGAYTYKKLEEKLTDNLNKLGYSSDERNKILKNMVGAMYAPYAPLGKTKTTMISFANAQDNVVIHNNYFQKYVQTLNNRGEFLFSYFPSQAGDVFIAPNYDFKDIRYAHNWVPSFTDSDRIKDLSVDLNAPNWIKTRDGVKTADALFGMVGNVVANSSINALTREPLPDVKTFVSDYRYVQNGYVLRDERATAVLDNIYQQMHDNGQKCLTKMKQSLKKLSENRKAHSQYVSHIALNELGDADFQSRIANSKSFMDVKYKDNGYFIEKDSFAVDVFKNLGFNLQYYNPQKDGYLISSADQVNRYLDYKQTFKEGMDLDCNLCFRPVYNDEKIIIGYEMPPRLRISAEKAEKLIKYYRSSEVGLAHQRIDLIYDADKKKIFLEERSVENYERFLHGQKRYFNYLKKLTVDKDGEFCILFDSIDELERVKKAYKNFGLDVSFHSNKLVINDMNELLHLQIDPGEIKRYLPENLKWYFRRDIDLNSPKTKEVIAMANRLEANLPENVTIKNGCLIIDCSNVNKEHFFDEFRKRANDLRIETNGYVEMISLSDTPTNRAFLISNLDKKGDKLSSLASAKNKMSSLSELVNQTRSLDKRCFFGRNEHELFLQRQNAFYELNDPLRMNDFKSKGGEFILDTTEMDFETRHNLISRYEELNIYPVEVSSENKIIIEREDAERFKQLQEYHIDTKTPYSVAKLKTDGVEVDVKDMVNAEIDTFNASKGRIERVAEGIQKGRAALNGMMDTAMAGAVGAGFKVAEPVLNTSVGQKVLRVKDTVADRFLQVRESVNSAKQGVVDKISGIKGGKKVVNAAKFVGRVSKVGGSVSVALGAAFDPKGTKEFIDDVSNLRVGKIVSETVEGGLQLVMHPKETGQALYEMSKNAVQERYQGAETLSDYALKTGEATIDGVTNIADTLTHLGSKGFEARNIVQNKAADVHNWIMEKFGFDTRMVKDTMTYDAYKKDPIAYVSRMFNPVTQSASTGLRSDDTLYTVIERGDVSAMREMISQGTDVNINIQGDYFDLQHNRHYTPYNTTMGMAVSKGHMDLASKLYKEGNVDVNGINTLTKETTFMSILRQIAPEQDSESYYTGMMSLTSYTDKAKANHLIGQALIDDILESGKLNLLQEDSDGKNAFLVAVETGNISAVEALIKNGVDINKTANDGSNALHLCVHNQLMTKVLIQSGVDLNQENKFGKTPLMLALESKKNDVCIEELLSVCDAKGISLVMNSEKHASLLNNWLEGQPQLRMAILISKDHPLRDELLKMNFETDKPNEEITSLAQEEAPEVKEGYLNNVSTTERSSNTSATLAQFSHAAPNQEEEPFQFSDVTKQMG